MVYVLSADSSSAAHLSPSPPQYSPLWAQTTPPSGGLKSVHVVTTNTLVLRAPSVTTKSLARKQFLHEI